MIRTLSALIALVIAAPLFAQNAAAKPEIPFGGTDFKQYYATSRLLQAGENPYDYAKVGEIQQGLGAEGEPQVPYGPPTSLLPFIPLGGLDFPTAVRIQLGLNIALLAASGCLWGAMLFPSQPMKFIGAVCVFLWLPSLILLGMGHVTGWTLFGFTAWCALMRAERPTLAGAVLALSIIKPHLAFALVGYAMLSGLRRRQWRMIAAFIGTVLLMSLVMAIIRPAIWGEYLASIPQSNPSRLLGATLDGFVRTYLGNTYRYAGYVFTLTLWALIAWLAWMGEMIPTRWALVPAVALAATPYAFTYDYVLALPGFVFAVGSWRYGVGVRRYFLLGAWLAVNAFYTFGKSEHWREEVYFVIPWATLALTYVGVRAIDSDSRARPRYEAR
jgi:hypothetical protein